MARLLIVYDPRGTLCPAKPDVAEHLGWKEAMLDIRDDIEGQDVYALAKKLAEMLLEQLA